jgi:hypothetical protein
MQRCRDEVAELALSSRALVLRNSPEITSCFHCGGIITTRRVSEGFLCKAPIPRLRVLKLPISVRAGSPANPLPVASATGLKKHCNSGLKGRHIRPCIGPPGLRFLLFAYRWLTPPALDLSALRA